LSGFLMAPLRFGIQKYMRVIECEDYTASIHKKLMPNPHYYVWGVGVDPNQQGKGLGRQILKPGIDRAQHKRLPV
jgi:ribosomal protein S18 acetylase RimI-like enzyme